MLPPPPPFQHSVIINRAVKFIDDLVTLTKRATRHFSLAYHLTKQSPTVQLLKNSGHNPNERKNDPQV